MFGVVAEDFLGIGTTEDLSHSLGRQPVRRVGTEDVILLAVDLSIRADILSRPVALHGSVQTG